MDKLRQLLTDARTRFDQLSARERRLVTVAGTAVLAFILFITLLSFANSASGYRRRTQDKLAKLQQVQQLAASYNEATQARKSIEQQLSASDVRLLSYISDKATASGLEVPNMTPKGEVGIGDGKILESSMELTFTDVDLRKLTDFLRSVESGPGIVKVKYLRVEPRPASESLTAWTTVSTYKLKK
ncbi:type II secretion system protein GspM [Stigmatella sp. ncwal1]|uniref:Type II secretion system protein GspM n=1 Tax=Stigmatella ashevillensis TaxID=2995309 RepID=A0ABT5DR33_9BACT|nr:type II secretion system protein GspM [Stigmatella ashevillena]MDC0714841.1 type II secretion system protein GspM [Stigmatella ashevillena]